MPQWAGSCWYYLRYIDPTNTEKPWETDLEKYWLPVDLYIGGKEHAVKAPSYARFWHKIFFDLGLVSTKEPLKISLPRNDSSEDGDKMSKSKGNVINPDGVVQEYGADTLRLYEMFMGPLDRDKPWSMNGVKGVYGFISSAFKVFGDSSLWSEDSEETTKLLHKTIKKVTEDIEEMKFNTAISQMMIFTNHCAKEKKFSKETATTFALLVSPFAPHVGEEVWETAGNIESIAYAQWQFLIQHWQKMTLSQWQFK